MPRWSHETEAVLRGDLTAGIAYVTPAGGAVVTAVAPLGLCDREAGRLTFTTSLAFARKLERLRRNPRIALAYHAREHGFASGDRYVLVQGRAELTEEPDRAFLESIEPSIERFLGKPRRGFFWDRWLHEYYNERVPVHVDAERVVSWPDLACAGERKVEGAEPPADPPPEQDVPKKGAGPRVDPERAAKRLGRMPHVLLAFTGADGVPVVVPVRVEGADAAGVRLAASEGLLPAGGRRAGLLGHDYEPQLVGLAVRQHTGWLTVPQEGARGAVYAPHTEQGFKAPSNKTLLLLANGALSKRGLRQARKAAKAQASPGS